MVKMCIYYHTGMDSRYYICLNANRVLVTISINGLNPFPLFCFVAVNQKTSFVCGKCSSVLGLDNEISVKTFFQTIFFPPCCCFVREMFRTKKLKLNQEDKQPVRHFMMVFTHPQARNHK